MVALLDDISIFHNQDHIGFPDRRKSVCNDEACSSLHHGCKCILNLDLRTSIN